jgi:hypothetical protein
LLKAANVAQKPQQKGKSQKNGKQVLLKVTCSHCGKAGHTKAECFILNPSLKNQPKGKQPQQGGGKTQCTFCHKRGHTADECFKARPELRSEGGKNKQPQEELRCSYCQMPDHTVERCYLLNPELRNPYHESPKPQDPWTDLANARKDNKDPLPRVVKRIRDAEALAFDSTPPEVQRHAKVQRIQGWSPERQTYFTLPMYGAVVDRPVKYNNNNPFNQALNRPAYEAFDTSGDTVMCSCGLPEGYECNLEHWVREAVEHEGLLRFSDRSENAFGRIMREGLVNPASTFEIY